MAGFNYIFSPLKLGTRASVRPRLASPRKSTHLSDALRDEESRKFIVQLCLCSLSWLRDRSMTNRIHQYSTKRLLRTFRHGDICRKSHEFVLVYDNGNGCIHWSNTTLWRVSIQFQIYFSHFLHVEPGFELTGGLGGFNPPSSPDHSIVTPPTPPSFLVPTVLLTPPVHFSQFEPCVEQIIISSVGHVWRFLALYNWPVWTLMTIIETANPTQPD